MIEKFKRIIFVYWLSFLIVSINSSFALEIESNKNVNKISPLTSKEIIYLLMKHYDVTLSVDKSCHNVGTQSSDSTIGQFMSGFLAYHTNITGRNWLETTSEQVLGSVQNGLLWKVTFMVYREHKEENEQWGWGVSFLVKDSDRTVLKNSFQCLGGG